MSKHKKLAVNSQVKKIASDCENIDMERIIERRILEEREENVTRDIIWVRPGTGTREALFCTQWDYCADSNFAVIQHQCVEHHFT